MRVGLVVLPVQPWPEARRTVTELEDAGFDSVWTCDHIEWGGWKGRPWFGAYPWLSAVAAATSRIRVGTLVSSISLRHPIELAQLALSVDHVSGGRFDLGIGAGSVGFDAAVHGHEPWSPAERVARFAEYVELVDALLTNERTTSRGTYYSAIDAPMHGGCVQRPRVPFTVAADKPRAMAVAARFGDRWVANSIYGEVPEKCARLDAACEAVGRDPASIQRVLLVDHMTHEVASFGDELARAASLGFSETVFRFPHGGDRTSLDALAASLPRSSSSSA